MLNFTLFLRFVKAFCQVQRPVVALVESELNLDNLFWDVDFNITREIANYSSVDTYFEWGLVRNLMQFFKKKIF